MTSGNCERSSHHVRCSMWIHKIKPQHFLITFLFCIHKKKVWKEKKWQLQLHHLEIEIFYPLLLCFRVAFLFTKKFSIAIKKHLWVKNITFAFFLKTHGMNSIYHYYTLYVTLCFRKSPPNISLQKQFKEMQTKKWNFGCHSHYVFFSYNRVSA